MANFTQIFIRPNTETPWFHETWDASHPLYVKTTYLDTNLMTINRSESPDGLELTIEYIFNTPAAEAAWFADEHLSSMSTMKMIHNESNAITQVQ